MGRGGYPWRGGTAAVCIFRSSRTATTLPDGCSTRAQRRRAGLSVLLRCVNTIHANFPSSEYNLVPVVLNAVSNFPIVRTLMRWG